MQTVPPNVYVMQKVPSIVCEDWFSVLVGDVGALQVEFEAECLAWSER